MKLVICILVFCSVLFGCERNELPAKQISDIPVVRETASNNNASQTKPSSVTAPTSTYQQSKARYHIIVASHGVRDKAKAQDMVTKLKALGYPASVLYSSQRYRVSLESFASEAEAKTKRDQYRIDLDTPAIWIHLVE